MCGYLERLSNPKNLELIVLQMQTCVHDSLSRRCYFYIILQRGKKLISVGPTICGNNLFVVCHNHDAQV